MKKSAGILLYALDNSDLRVLLVHPGGPFWARRDLGAWSIPKGEYDTGELPECAARREFAEETGMAFAGELTDLGEARQSSGKRVTAFAGHGDFDVTSLRSNIFEMEWPPHSGRQQAFPEIDRAAWFDLNEAKARILSGQITFLDRLAELLGGSVALAHFASPSCHYDARSNHH